MNFGQAIEALKDEKRVCRSGWNGKGIWLSLIEAEEWTAKGISNRLPWIGMKTADDGFVPWLASQTDMLSEDWQALD
jgi:hypothetical protein